MSFGKLKRALQGLINRKDLTDELAGDFVTRAIREVERPLRIGPMEVLLEATEWDGKKSAVNIPFNYLELIDVFTTEGTFESADRDAFLKCGTAPAQPVFMRAGPAWLLKPTPKPGDTVYVHYFAETPGLQADTDENVWTKSGFNAVLYAAAALAADYFQMEDEYVQRFEGKAASFTDAIGGQDLQERWAPQMTVGPVRGAGEH